MFWTTQRRTQTHGLWANIIKSIIEKKATTPLKSRGKCLSKENIIGNANVNWENTYRFPFLCTTETKLQVFQFMFLHRRIATNDFLFKICLRAESCSFCGEFTETLAHLFWYCKYTKKFWKDINQWITQNTTLNKPITFSPLICLGLIDNISDSLSPNDIFTHVSYPPWKLKKRLPLIITIYLPSKTNGAPLNLLILNKSKSSKRRLKVVKKQMQMQSTF